MNDLVADFDEGVREVEGASEGEHGAFLAALLVGVC